jgi:ppGpp synthetase/RelA/SpoT-type nucleotidyltranferase
MRDQLIAATDEFVALVTGIIDEAGINYLTVTGRTKSVPSFTAKARGILAADPGADPLVAVTDQVGVRVITYVQRDIDAVAELLAEQFTVLDDRDLGEETAAAGRFGYASRHLLVSRATGDAGVSAAGDPTAYEPLTCASIQLRTVLQHAWAEFEHDIRYKGTVPPEQVPDLDRRFTLAAGLIELADREFGAIRDRLQAGLGDSSVGAGRRARPAHQCPGARDLPRRALLQRRVVTHRPLRVDLGAAPRARHRLAGRAECHVARRRQLGGDGGDGLQVPARCGAPTRRRPALPVRRHLRRPPRQRPPARGPRSPPRQPHELAVSAEVAALATTSALTASPAGYFTSARRTRSRPMASGTRNQIVPAVASCCHCSPVRLPSKRRVCAKL